MTHQNLPPPTHSVEAGMAERRWWNLYLHQAGKQPKAILAMEAEFGSPGWVFGIQNYAALPDGKYGPGLSDPSTPGPKRKCCACACACAIAKGTGVGLVPKQRLACYQAPYACRLRLWLWQGLRCLAGSA